MSIIKGTSNIPTSGGGGSSNAKQLYEHNISLRNHVDYSSGNVNVRVFITIPNDSDEEYTLDSLINYLYSNNFVITNTAYKDRNKFKKCSGGYTYSNDVQYACGGIACSSDKTGFYFNVGTMGRVEYVAKTSFVTSPNVTFSDTVITL